MGKFQYPQLVPEADFETWSATNEQELTCIFAETGADRELDFNREQEELKIYESDERNMWHMFNRISNQKFFYKLEGKKPVSCYFSEFKKASETQDWILKQSEPTQNIKISTRFLGINTDLISNEPKVFETILFYDKMAKKRITRSSYEAAIEDHDLLCADLMKQQQDEHILYRRVRSSLEESMETIVPFKTEEELFYIIQEDYSKFLELEKIDLGECTFDKRNQWHTYPVIAYFKKTYRSKLEFGDHAMSIVGYTNGLPYY